MLTRSFMLRFLFGLGLGSVIVVLTVFNTLLIWVATGPRVLDQFTPAIEQALSAEDGSYQVKIRQTVLVWDGWRNPIDIKLRGVQLLTRKGKEFSRFPDVSLGIDIPSAMIGAIRPTRLVVNEPTITLRQYDDYSIGIGYGQHLEDGNQETEEDISPTAIILATFSGADKRLSKLERVNITGAHVNIRDTIGNTRLNAENTQLTFLKDENDGIKIQATSSVRYGPHNTEISAVTTLDQDGEHLRGGLQFDEIIPAEVERIFLGSARLKKLAMPMEGGVQFALMLKDRHLKKLGFQIRTGQAAINHDLLDGTLHLDRLEARGEALNNLSVLHIHQLTADMDGIGLSAQGEVSLHSPFWVKGSAELKHADAKDIRLLWPPSLSPVSRAWVTENIVPAEIPRAGVTVDIKAGDIEKPILPRESIIGTIHVKNGTIKYLPGHPSVTAMDAVIKVDSVGMKADITQASYMKQSRLTAGTLTIDDLNADNPRINVKFKAESTAAEAVKVLTLPRLEHAKRLGLKPSIKGELTADIDLSFDFYSPRNEDGTLAEDDNIDYDVQANVKGITQTGVLKKFDLKSCHGRLHVKNGSLTFNGGGNVNGATVEDATIKHLFTPEEGLDTFVTVTANAPITSLPRFGYPSFEFLSGAMGVTADVELGPEKEQAVATLDLSKTQIDDNALGWVKPKGKAATLDIQLFKQDGKITIPSFNLKGGQASLSGNAALNKALTDVESLELRPSSLGKSKIKKLVFKQQGNAITLHVDAQTLNLVNYLSRDEKGKGFSFQHFPALNLNTNIKTLTLEAGYPIQNFVGKMQCDKMICTSANVRGDIAEKTFQFKILKNPKGQRQISFHGDNAGLILKSLGIFDGMESGLLTISGNFDDEGKTRSALTGRLIIGHFTLKDAPVLAKILTLASFTGFIDTMQGNGIAFKQLSVPFTLQGDVLEIKKAKAVGPAIGLTAEGTISMPKIFLDVAGTVVPSYTLNHGVGKVPLVGPLLTGGGNSGVFAARYDVKGNYEEPKVGVNPLSMLTPGFLRNLFDVFDEPKEKKN